MRFNTFINYATNLLIYFYIAFKWIIYLYMNIFTTITSTISDTFLRIFIHFCRSFCIIVENSSKSISPLPSPSTSLMTSSQTLSSIYYPEHKISFTSSLLIDPLPSLSNNENAAFNFSVDNSFSLFIVATTHSI